MSHIPITLSSESPDVPKCSLSLGDAKEALSWLNAQSDLSPEVVVEAYPRELDAPASLAALSAIFLESKHRVRKFHVEILPGDETVAAAYHFIHGLYSVLKRADLRALSSLQFSITTMPHGREEGSSGQAAHGENTFPSLADLPPMDALRLLELRLPLTDMKHALANVTFPPAATIKLLALRDMGPVGTGNEATLQEDVVRHLNGSMHAPNRGIFRNLDMKIVTGDRDEKRLVTKFELLCSSPAGVSSIELTMYVPAGRMISGDWKDSLIVILIVGQLRYVA